MISDIEASKILIVGPAWIGDMVMAQSLYRLLKKQDPEAVIDVVAPSWSEPLVRRMAEVHATVNMPLGHGEFGFMRRRNIGRALRARNYDRSIVLPRSFKSALVPFFARIPVRTGFRAEMRYGLLNDLRPLDRLVLDQTVKRFLALGLPLGQSVPPPPPRLTIDEQNLARLRDELALSEPAAAVALMPGAAYGPAKRWPLEYFSRLAAELAAAGVSVWVLGSDGEHADGEHIRNQAGEGVVNLCGRTRLEDAVDLLSAASAAVTNDSGLMHVAAAAGTHVVAIYGSTSPRFTPPMTERATIHYLGLECSPCFKRECPLGHLKCLRDISPDAVLSGVRDVLRGAA